MRGSRVIVGVTWKLFRYPGLEKVVGFCNANDMPCYWTFRATYAYKLLYDELVRQ